MAILALVALAGAGLSSCTPGHLPKAPPPPTTSRTPKTTTTSSATATTNATSSTTTGTSPAQSVAYNTDAAAAVAVGRQPRNWDIHSAGAAPWGPTLSQVLAQIWPSAFYVNPTGGTVLNSSLLNSATEVSSSPQTIVYQIDPRAQWSDGAPITYADFAYNWRAQSGLSQYYDKGGAPFTPADRSGYDDIASVSGTAANPYLVTVTFSTPYPDWRSLFSYLAPAHVATSVGFDSGFTDPVADLVSGGPFVVSDLQPGYSLELVRNARYWGPPANLAAVTYYFTSSATQVVDALGGAEVDFATLPATTSSYNQLQADSGVTTHPLTSAVYEDLDFNERGALLFRPLLRQAIMLATDRATMAADVLGPYGLSAGPLDNRAFVVNAPSYVANGASFDQPAPAAAAELLARGGYHVVSGDLRAPGGAVVDLTLTVAAGDPEAQELAPQIVASCAAIGIVVTVDDVGGTGTGALGAPVRPALGEGWQMAIEQRAVPAFPSAIAERYASGGAANLDGYSSSAMSALLAQISSTSSSELPALYNEIDNLAWDDFVDLPLVAVPVLVADSSHLLNVAPGPYFYDMVWDEQSWGFPVS